MHEVTEIKNPGSFETPSQLRLTLMSFIGIGAVTFAAGLAIDPERLWIGFLMNHFYFLSLGIGGLFFAAIQWVTGAMWSAPVRRLAESFSSYLPFSLFTFLVLLVGIPKLYLWSHLDIVQSDVALQGKAAYLNVTFFAIRNSVAIIGWILFAGKMIGNSKAQDQSKDYTYTLKNRVLGPLFLMFFAITFTMASFDQIMSLDPRWASTIFGVYCFSGSFYSTLAATCLLALYLDSKGKLDGIINLNHFHDLGKFMFAFTVFWAYIAASQFILIWYANLPEETIYYIKRFNGGWYWTSLFLLLGKFVIPFFTLITRGAKRNPKTLLWIGMWMLFCQWIDVLWMVQPEFYADGPTIGWVEFGLLLGFVGLFGISVSRFLARSNIVAIGDPRLEEAVFHHHQ